ncbi:MAG: TrpR-like protein [Oscillospiraceae bacterium]|nr:TrpR-like protein [Oscillospiraceae bacterium]MDE6998233.1 TrpR-like protein [Oscillospiraceae bacterium]
MLKYKSKERGQLMDVFHTPGAELLVQAVLSLKTEEECRAFLEDLMTGREIHDCSQRILVAALLRRNLVYSRIAQETGASSATISRVNRCCVYGAGGYQTVLERMEEGGN